MVKTMVLGFDDHILLTRFHAWDQVDSGICTYVVPKESMYIYKDDLDEILKNLVMAKYGSDTAQRVEALLKEEREGEDLKEAKE